MFVRRLSLPSSSVSGITIKSPSMVVPPAPLNAESSNSGLAIAKKKFHNAFGRSDRKKIKKFLEQGMCILALSE